MSKRTHNKPKAWRLNREQRVRARKRKNRRRWISTRSWVSKLKFFRVGGFGFNAPRAVARRKRRVST